LKFERDDWSLFRTVEGLQQKAGVAKDKLPRLVLKELADNGLDENATTVRTGELPKGGWFVEDDGPGIDGTPGDIARLFSIARPMLSSKLLRLPTRGTLGNGLRVVAGAVLASGGSLNVTTRNRRIVLRPERDGSSTVVSSKPVKFPIGTRIEIGFGSALPCDDDTPLYWADTACCLAGSGSSYSGKSSPWWYDAPQFHELLYASGSTPVRELISHLDGAPARRPVRLSRRPGSAEHSARTSPASRPRGCWWLRGRAPGGWHRRALAAWARRRSPTMPMRARTVSPGSAPTSRTPKSPSSSRRGPKRRISMLIQT
jgi:hypothetical protein